MKLFAELMLEGNKQALKNNLYTTDNAVSGGFGKNVNKKDVKKIVKVGLLKEALEILHYTEQPGMWLDATVYASLLQTCIDVKAWPEGQRVHAHMIKTGFKPGVILSNIILNMYIKCGKLLDARQMFDKMCQRNAVSWTTMISGYEQNGLAEEALRLVYEMHCGGVELNAFTFVKAVRVMVEVEDLEFGRQAHGLIIKSGFVSNLFLESILVDLYGKCGKIADAFQVFDRMSERDVVSWTAMIAGCVKQGDGEGALILFSQMQRQGVEPNQFTVASLLKACAKMRALREGRQVHAAIFRNKVRPDAHVNSALIDMYVKCGRVVDARQVFDRMHTRNNVLWTAMIAGYAQNGCGEEAIALFRQMQRAGIKVNNFTLVSVLRACVLLEALKHGKQVHARIVKSEYEPNTHLWSTLVGLYGKCGDLEYAGHLFAGIPIHDVVSWTARIVGCVRQGLNEEALVLFEQMRREGVKPNEFTYTSILRACASLEALEQGKQIHGSINKTQFESNVYVGSALIDLYAKCGSLVQAQYVFDSMPSRNTVSWNVIILGYLRHRYSKEALKLLYRMLESGMRPEESIVISVLNACGSSHS